jgi:hypothetical protein
MNYLLCGSGITIGLGTLRKRTGIVVPAVCTSGLNVPSFHNGLLLNSPSDGSSGITLSLIARFFADRSVPTQDLVAQRARAPTGSWGLFLVSKAVPNGR